MTPASGSFLLDTNILIAILHGEKSALSNLKMAAAVYVPAVALGELYFGAAKSGRRAENAARVNNLASTSTVLVCDLGVVQEYGLVKQRLRKKGRPIPENDAWIAAMAKHFGLVLVTRDGHFEAVEGLVRVNWAEAAS